MDQQLRLNILSDVIGSEKIDLLKGKISGLQGTAIETAAKFHLYEKAVEYARMGVEKFLEVIEKGEAFEILSEKTGIAASKISQFQGAATQANVSSETLEKTLKKFSMSMGDMGNEKFASAMRFLGVSTKEANGTLRDSSEVILDVSEKFSKMKDGPTKAALAMSMFGKSGADMIPLLNMGSEEIGKFGYKMSVDFPENARTFNDSIEITKKQMMESTMAMVNQYLPAINQVISAFNSIDDLDPNKKGDPAVSNAIKVTAEGIYVLFNFIVNGADLVFNSIKSILSGVWTVAKEVWEFLKGISESIYRIATFDFKNVGSGFKNLGKASKDWALQTEKDFSDMTDRVVTRTNKMNLFEKNLFSDDTKQADKKNKKATPDNFDSTESSKLKSQREAIEKFNITQKAQIDLEKEKIENYALSTSELKKNEIAIQLRTQSEKESVGWAAKTKSEMMLATEAIIAQKQALIDLQDRQKESFGVGAKTAFKSYLEGLRDVAKQTEQMFSRAFGNMEDALVSFVKSGQLNFKKFADAIIDDLIRIAVRQATLGVLTSIGMSVAGGATASASTSGYSLGNPGVTVPTYHATGGVMSGLGSVPLRAYASGGIATHPQMAIFGEGSTPEAYVPLPDGRSIPVSIKNSSAGNVNINVVVNAESGQTSVEGNGGLQLGNSLAAAIRNQIAVEKRPGGLLSGRS